MARYFVLLDLLIVVFLLSLISVASTPASLTGSKSRKSDLDKFQLVHFQLDAMPDVLKIARRKPIKWRNGANILKKLRGDTVGLSENTGDSNVQDEVFTMLTDFLQGYQLSICREVAVHTTV